MIAKLIIKDVEKMPISWWGQVRGLKEIKEFSFKPGLNVVWGPNGYGKTTLLRALAHIFQCEQGGIPRVTQMSVLGYIHDAHAKRMGDALRELPDGFEVAHDGQPVHYFSPDTPAGFACKGAAFDDDFFEDAIYSLANPRSSGQVVNDGLSRVLNSAETLEKVELEACGEKAEAIYAVLQDATIEKGQRTVILDEPDRSLDLWGQIQFWKRVSDEFSKDFQFIIATHSPLVLNCPSVHFIELAPNYLDLCREAIKGQVGHVDVMEKQAQECREALLKQKAP